MQRRRYIVCLWLVATSLAGCHTAPKASYTTAVLDTGAMREIISATGEVTARNRVNIGSQISGTIARVRVDFNDAVHAGDVLAEIAPKVYVAQAARAQASFAVAQADVERAQLDLADARRTQKRHTTLAQGEMLSAADVDKSNVAVDLAAANLKKAQAAVLQAQADQDQAQANVALTQIRSPIDGVVIDRQVEVGQTVAAQFQVATLFVVVGELEHVRVIVNIDEADVGQIKPGMPARFGVDAYPQTTFVGRLHSLRQAPVGMSQATPNTTGVVTYAAVIEADNPNGLLMQGMTAQLDLEKGHVDEAVRLPLAALRFVPQGEDAAAQAKAGPAQASDTSDASVWLLEGGVPVKRQVRLGLRDGRFVEAQSGLAKGDTVIVGQVGGGDADAAPKRSTRRARG